MVRLEDIEPFHLDGHLITTVALRRLSPAETQMFCKTIDNNRDLLRAIVANSLVLNGGRVRVTDAIVDSMPYDVLTAACRATPQAQPLGVEPGVEFNERRLIN